MMAVIEEDLRAHIRARFLHWGWMGPVGNLVAGAVWVLSIAPTGIGPSTRIAWSVVGVAVSALMTLAYRVPRSVQWTDSSGLPRLSLVAHVLMGSLWGVTLWLGDGGGTDPTYMLGTIAVMLGISAGSMGSSCGAARMTGALLIPIATGAIAALALHGFVAEAVGISFLTLVITPVQIESAAGIRELLLLRLESEASACHDPLTGALNRRGLSRAVDELDPGVSVDVFYADLDSFKSINDEFGHGAGDQVLTGVANRMTSRLPASALIARVGGDEFVAVVPVGSTEVECLTERINDAFVEPFGIDSPSSWAIPVQASLGCVRGPAAQVHSALIAKADREMMTAKRLGRSNILSIVDQDRRGAGDGVWTTAVPELSPPSLSQTQR